MAHPDPKFAVKDNVIIHFSDRDDHGTVKSRSWSAAYGQWSYQVERPATAALPNGGSVVLKGEKTGWVAPEEMLSKA